MSELPPRRTVVLSLDSMDLLLVQRWAAQGLLPFFEKLLREWPLVRLTTVSRVLQPAVWPSLMTGQSPGFHGNYSYEQLRKGTYNLEPVHSDQIDGERFHERLGAHGVRCAIVDIPKDLPDPKFNGIHVVDWATEMKYWRYETQPPEFAREIATRVGKHVLTEYGGTGMSMEAHRKLRADLEQGIRLKATLTRQLLERKDLDLILVTWGEPHKGGHFLWKYMDAAHPDHVGTDDYLSGGMLAIYQLIDAEFADIASRLTPQDNVIVFTDHGMQANYRGEHFLEPLLERFGLCKAGPGQARMGAGVAPPASLLSRTVRTARRTLRKILTKIAPAGVNDALRSRFGVSARVDWSNTRAFILPTDRNSYIRINLRGREPSGTVAPGAEYQRLMDEIEREFRALVNAETGAPAVEEVFRPQELYPGPRANELPDLTILWSSEAPLNVLESPRIGRLEKRISEDRSGNHRPEGFLFARGPAFRKERTESSGDILQIAPTLLTLHGVAPPDTYQAGPLEQILVS